MSLARRLCLVAASGAALATGSMGQDANVVLIVADDQRYDSISAFGGAIATPNIDRIAGHGFSFTHTYNMGSNSPAVCAPSRAMYLTGRNLASAWNSQSIDGVPSIPSTFKAAGYATFGTGKWHQSQASFIQGFAAGDEILFGGCIGCSATSHHGNQVAKNLSYNATLRRLSGGVISGGSVAAGVHVSERFADAATAFMAQQPAGSPYFTYVSFTGPHDPRTSPPAFENLYRDPFGVSTVSLPQNFSPATPIDRSAFDGTIRDEVILSSIGGHTPSNVAEELADYYGMISHMDAQIGRVIDEALRAEGLDPLVNDLGDLTNTLIVFTSDHGLAIGSHGLMGKQNPFEHSIRAAPLTITGAVGGTPIPTGASDAFVYLTDIFPTIADLVGVAIPASVQGQSLASVILGTQASVRSSIYNAYRSLSRAVRDGDWKLMYYPGLHRVQLFDLASDPNELNDLSADMAEWPRVETLGEELRQLEGQLNAPGAGLVPDMFFSGVDIAWEPAQNVQGLIDLPITPVAVALTGGASPVTAGGIQFSPLNLGQGPSGGALDGRTTGDSGYDQLLNSLTFGGGLSTTLELTGLTPGKQYVVQAWFADLRPGSDGRRMTFSNVRRVAVAGESAAPPLQVINVSGNLPGVDPAGFLGQFARGTFVASAVVERLGLRSNGFDNAHLNALVVSEFSAAGPGLQFCSGAPGEGTPCPCANDNDGGPGGCDWGSQFFTGGGVLRGTGTASFTANDLLLVAEGVPNDFGLFFAGSDPMNGGAGAMFYDGLLCVGGTLLRLSTPSSALFHSNATLVPLPSLDAGIVVGTTRRYQYWFRSSGPCGSGANSTNGYAVTWLP